MNEVQAPQQPCVKLQSAFTPQGLPAKSATAPPDGAAAHQLTWLPVRRTMAQDPSAPSGFERPGDAAATTSPPEVTVAPTAALDSPPTAPAAITAHDT